MCVQVFKAVLETAPFPCEEEKEEEEEEEEEVGEKEKRECRERRKEEWGRCAGEEGKRKRLLAVRLPCNMYMCITLKPSFRSRAPGVGTNIASSPSMGPKPMLPRALEGSMACRQIARTRYCGFCQRGGGGKLPRYVHVHVHVHIQYMVQVFGVCNIVGVEKE